MRGYNISHKMRRYIVLDDDDASPASTSAASMERLQPVQSGGLFISQEQRERMAQQKELAKKRRLAKENSKLSIVGRSTPPQPRILDTSDFPGASAAVHHSHSQHRQEEAQGQSGHELPSPYFAANGGVASVGIKRSHEAIIDLTGANEGWRSVRKRPMPGRSFGREINGLANAEGDHGQTSGTRRADLHSDAIRKDEQAIVLSQNLVPTEGPIIDSRKSRKAKLSEEQMHALKAITSGKSVFLTGSAGTGKSFVIDNAVRFLRIVHGGEGVYVTASTGLAACALGGTTLHSFAGVGLGKGKKEDLVERAKVKKEVRNRWLYARALIIDEISMVDGEFFDKLDYMGRTLRKMQQPFGGIQLIVTGDFYQLPPVNPENPAKYFAFEADCWDKCFNLQIELKNVFRQSDGDFVGMLNEIRRGECSPSNQMRLQNCSGPVGDNSGIGLTRLYPRKTDVSRENDENLRTLSQPTVVFRAMDEARNEFARRLLENTRVEPVISLALGAQVMLAKNLETSAGLVNGAKGVVVGFTSPDDPRSIEIQKTSKRVNPSGLWPIVRFASDNLERVIQPESWTITEGDVEVAKRTQIPLLLAWALSVHKCQGMTLDRVETDLSRAFDYGMVYVALSRVKSLEGLRLLGFDPSRIKVHPKVSQFYDKLHSKQSMLINAPVKLIE